MIYNIFIFHFKIKENFMGIITFFPVFLFKRLTY